MQLYRHPKEVIQSEKGCVVALGNFDGFHRGHHVVIGEAGRLAREMGLNLAVVVTEPHPISFFQPDKDPFRLTPFRPRSQLLEKFGVDVLMVLPFDKNLASLGAQDFVYQVLLDGLDAHEVVHHIENVGIDLLPANADMTAAEVDLMRADNAEQRLKTSIAPIVDEYDYVLIDCPPALNMLTLNAMVAADGVIIPMQCEYYALEGLTSLMETIDQVRSSVNPDLKIEGLLRTMFDRRNTLANDVSAQLIEHFGDRVYRTIVPRNVRLAEAPSYGLPALLYEKTSRGALAYLALAGEMLRRESRAKAAASLA